MSKHRGESSNPDCKSSHQIQFQLYDSYGLPVDGTQFWASIIALKEGHKITLQLPVINFQTGPIASNDTFSPLPGGTLRTVDGFLPKKLRPSDPVYRSYLGASNNGMSEAFSFTQDPATLPVPPPGYIVSVTLAGGIVVSCAGTFNDLIAPGPQILMPTDITYLVQPTEKLRKNFVLSSGASDVTQFTGIPADNAYRDSHVNDAFDGLFAWTWVDNSMIADKTNGTMNAMVAIGRLKNGKLKPKKPIQLSNFAPNIASISTAVAINRTDKNNIVVSYGVLDYNTLIEPTYRAVSFDGGKTWPVNGPTNIQPPGPYGGGDCRGVTADKYGNFWYEISNYTDVTGTYFINQPAFWISSDKGVTFSLVYTAPLPFILGVEFWDFPQFCFGGDGSGNYGMWFVTDYFLNGIDVVPVVGFIPITGLGTYGAVNIVYLYSLVNTEYIPNITAASDGRVWIESYTNMPSFLPASVVRFKSPGPLDSNYAGTWQATISLQDAGYGIPTYDSFPGFGYFNSAQTIIYDETKQALYALFASLEPDNSQNTRVYLVISRNNGQTWSNPLYISNSNAGNRGFPSMALDTVTGDLAFGWYDGRNDPTFKRMEYFGAVIPAKTLTELVDKIPLSDPQYTLPPPTISAVTSINTNIKKRQEIRRKRLERKSP